MNHTSVIMAYKDSIFLEDCIMSLKNQTYKSTIYIATSTPTDFIKLTAKKHNIPLFIIESNRGIAFDWNYSLKIANTKYVTLAHQDDIYEPEYIEKCISAAERNNDTLICFTDYTEIITLKNRKFSLLPAIKKIILSIFTLFNNGIRNKFLKNTLLLFGNPIACPTVMFNLQNVNKFTFSDEYEICLDWAAWIDLGKINGKFIYVPKSLVKHRLHRNSATSNGLQNKARQKEDFKIFSKLWPKPIAKFLIWGYSLSYKLNKI